jgi:GT2 family glycosyltransferase
MPSITINSDSKLVPFFSVVILCWHSEKYIFACLDALNNQIDKDFEILLVDNGSPTPLDEQDFKAYADLKIKFLPLKNNIGFAAGNNYAAQIATGRYLVLLNADAFPDRAWLKNIRVGIQKYPHSFFASKLVMANHPERYDGTGDIYHFSGLVWRKSYNALIEKYPAPEREVFSACGAAAIFPKEAFEQVGGFDPDYFSYLEDIDLGFRLRLIGYKCIYLPNAVVMHVGSASTGRRSDFSVYYGHRNLIWTYLKNMPGLLVILLLPFHMLANLFQIALCVFRKQGSIALRARKDALNDLSTILHKRKLVQENRTAPILSVLKAMDWNPISPLVKVRKNG